MPQWFEPAGLGTIAIIAVVSCFVIGWVIFRLPFKQRSKLATVTSQAFAVFISCLLVLTLIAVCLNRVNLWYPSWQSIFKSPINAEVETTSTADLENSQSVGWVTAATTPLQADPKSNPAFADHNWSKDNRGDYLQVDIPNPSSGEKTASTLIWLPPSYLKQPDRFYPVILAMHGLPGNPNVYQETLQLGEKINALVAANGMREAIVVAPNIFPNNRDTECVDSDDGSVKMESFLINDLMPWIRNNLRTVPDPKAWSTIGYSAGGWCSTMLSVRHPGQIANSINMSGYFAPTFEGKKLVSETDQRYQLGQLVKNERPAINILFWAARDDTSAMDAYQGFVDQVSEPTTLTSSFIDAGGHSWAVWQRATPDGLAWLAKTSPQFSWVKS